MANAITPTLRASLERIKHAGSINGICLAWRRQVLINLMPFEDFRTEQLVQTLIDAREHFQSGGGRYVDTLWIGFLDVHALIVYGGDLTVAVLHSRADESDYLTGVVKTFLNDTQLLVAGALNPNITDETPSEEGEDWMPQPPRPDPNQTNLVS